MPCPADAPGLERQREREEERDRAGLEPLADADRAGDRDRHQQIHVGAQPPQRQPGLGKDRKESGGDTGSVEEAHEERNRLLAAQPFAAEGRAEVAGKESVAEEAARDRRAGEDGQEQPSPAQTVARATADLAVGPPRLGRETRPAHPFQDGGVGDPMRLGVDRHPAAQQVEAEPCFAADDRTELAPQCRDLLCAIHPCHAEAPRLCDGHCLAAPSPAFTVPGARETLIFPRTAPQARCGTDGAEESLCPPAARIPV